MARLGKRPEAGRFLRSTETDSISQDGLDATEPEYIPFTKQTPTTRDAVKPPGVLDRYFSLGHQLKEI
jgi:hypothetical protein